METLDKDSLIKLLKAVPKKFYIEHDDGKVEESYWHYDVAIIEVDNFKTAPNITIKDADFKEKPISITKNNELFCVDFINCNFGEVTLNGSPKVKFENCTFEVLHVQHEISGTAFDFSGGFIKRLDGTITNIKFRNVSVDSLFYYSSRLELNLFKNIDNIIFKNDRMHGGAAKLGLNIKNIIFENFHTQNAPTISNFISTKGSKVTVDNSDLENIRFFNCDFSNTTLYFRNSDLLNLKYTNTKLPLKALEFENKIPSTEAYRQLKIVSIKHFDRFNELKYKAREQNAYLKEIKSEIKNKKGIFKGLWYRCSYFNSWLILSFNKISNYYGTRWWQALLLIIIVGFGFYCWYLKTLCVNIYEYKALWSNYWQFLSPFHSMQLLGGDYYYSGYSYFVDIFHRIINYFLIYQGVQAFRMYGKN